MRSYLPLAAVLAVSACSFADLFKEPVAEPVVARDESKCYTVDLFDEHRIRKPRRNVPAQYAAFSGAWGGGAWDGAWCHDLYILDVAADGAVKMIETYAPQPDWGRRAAAFRRTARIDAAGVLRVSYGAIRVEYRVEGDRLTGLRREGGSDPMRITLHRGAVYSPLKGRR